jgi:hypothetical protein
MIENLHKQNMDEIYKLRTQLSQIQYELENDSYVTVKLRMATEPDQFNTACILQGNLRTIRVCAVGAHKHTNKYKQVRLVSSDGSYYTAKKEMILDACDIQFVSPIPHITGVELYRADTDMWVPILVRSSDPNPTVLIAQCDVEILANQHKIYILD